MVDWDERKYKYREHADSGSIIGQQLHKFKKIPETPEIWMMLKHVVCALMYIYI